MDAPDSPRPSRPFAARKLWFFLLAGLPIFYVGNFVANAWLGVRTEGAQEEVGLGFLATLIVYGVGMLLARERSLKFAAWALLAIVSSYLLGYFLWWVIVASTGGF